MARAKQLGPRKTMKKSRHVGSKSSAYAAYGNRAPKSKKDMKHSMPSKTASKWKGRKANNNYTNKNAS